MLADRHLAFLRARAVSDAIIARRGYETADASVLVRAGFGFEEAKRYAPGLLIPRYGLTGAPTAPKVRPDIAGRNGPVVNRVGHVIKYASPGGSWNFVDCLPGSSPFGGGDLWVSAEGFVKGDAMASAGLAVVSIDGVYGWRSQREVVPGFMALVSPGRWFHIVCDSDFRTNPDVARATCWLASALRQMGAKARVLHPPGTGKMGVDDFLAASGQIGQLVEVPRLVARRAVACRRFAAAWRSA